MPVDRRRGPNAAIRAVARLIQQLAARYSEEEIVFMKAMDQYKRANRRLPTWSEVLECSTLLVIARLPGVSSAGLAPPVPRPALPKD